MLPEGFTHADAHAAERIFDTLQKAEIVHTFNDGVWPHIDEVCIALRIPEPGVLSEAVLQLMLLGIPQTDAISQALDIHREKLAAKAEAAETQRLELQATRDRRQQEAADNVKAEREQASEIRRRRDLPFRLQCNHYTHRDLNVGWDASEAKLNLNALIHAAKEAFRSGEDPDAMRDLFALLIDTHLFTAPHEKRKTASHDTFLYVAKYLRFPKAKSWEELIALQEEMQALHHPLLQTYITIQIKQKDVNKKVIKSNFFM